MLVPGTPAAEAEVRELDPHEKHQETETGYEKTTEQSPRAATISGSQDDPTDPKQVT